MHTSVSRVHGDEDGAGGVQFDLCALEEEDGRPRVDASLDSQDLLGHHRQHLQVNPVELVKARPSSAGRQSLEELAQGNVVQSVRAVEYYTLGWTETPT